MQEEEPVGPSTRNRIGNVQGPAVQVGAVHGPVHVSGTSGKVLVTAIVAAVAVVIAVTVVVLDKAAAPVVNNTNSNNMVIAGTSESVSPESVVAVQGLVYGDLEQECNTFYVSEPKIQDAMAVTDGSDWSDLAAIAEGRVDGAMVITAQARGDEAVLLTGMRLVDFDAGPPPTTGVLLSPVCGGVPVIPRNFKVELDRPSPVISPTEDNDAGRPIPAQPFPFKISGSEPEVFYLIVERNEPCDCRFSVEVDWVVQGNRGTSRVDNSGKGFRVVVGSPVPEYILDHDAGVWVRR